MSLAAYRGSATFNDMRALVAICGLAALLLAGCDPGGLRRVQLRLPPTRTESSSIAVDQPDVQEALRILDAVVMPLGFQLSPEPLDHGYIRVYKLSHPPATMDHARAVPIRVTKTPTGIEVSFGDFGLLGGTPEPVVRAFKGARIAFVTKYGYQNVKTKTFGSSNQRVARDAGRSPRFAFSALGHRPTERGS